MENKIISLLILMLAISGANSLYCSSQCIDYVDICSGINYNQCTLCSTTAYELVPQLGACVLLNQTQIIAVDLENSNSLSDFQGNNLNPASCGSYFLSGNYIQGNYLTKTYSTPSPHYMLIARFNIGYMGIWSTTDVITVNVDNIPYSFSYACGYPETICTPPAYGNDCIRIKQINATHNSSSALISFSSSIITNPSILQTWGLKDLMIILKTCHAQCISCYGPASTQCIVCSPGFYLIGNTCVQSCPTYHIPDLGICANKCPSNYYVELSTSSCQICSHGCEVCTGPLKQNCILQSTKSTLWMNQKAFWIFLIILGSFLLLMSIYCLIRKRRSEVVVDSLKQPINKVQNNVEENNINNSTIEIKDDFHAKQSKIIYDNELQIQEVQDEQNERNNALQKKKNRKKKKQEGF